MDSVEPARFAAISVKFFVRSVRLCVPLLALQAIQQERVDHSLTRARALSDPRTQHALVRNRGTEDFKASLSLAPHSLTIACQAVVLRVNPCVALQLLRTALAPSTPGEGCVVLMNCDFLKSADVKSADVSADLLTSVQG